MKKSNRTAVTAAVILVLAAAMLLGPVFAEAQLPRDPVERARVIEQIFQANSRQLTLLDREGKELSRVGPRDLYNQPVFSPDGKRLAVIKANLDKETNDLWVVDVASGKSVQVTTSKEREGVAAPAWSPDGRHVAYVSQREGFFSLYRKPSDGTGAEELLYKGNAPMTLTDWSMDGRFLTYFSTDLKGGAIFALPVNADGERKPIEIFRSSNQVQGPRLSPDNRFVVYSSNPSGRFEIYVRPFNPTGGPAPAGGPWQISDQGGNGMAFWRRDGKELYYLALNRAVMAVSITTSPDFEFGKPKQLFRPDESTPIAPGVASINRDGDRIIFAVPPPQFRQITIYDRQGKVLNTVGQPGLYQQPGFSPDGTRIVAMRNDPQTGNQDIWTFDIATGKGIPITNDTPPQNAPIWSPDSKYVAYVSTRESYSSIYRRAADGTGEEEMLFRYTPGAGVMLTDWSPDGKFLTFFGGVLSLVHLRPEEKALDRKEIEWLREDYDALTGRFSPDGRFMAYLSNEKDPERLEVYVRPFDSGKPDTPPPGPPAQISTNGAIGMVTWRQDGRELYYMTRDWEVMAVDVTTNPTFKAGAPRLLFKMQGPLSGNSVQWKNVSADGQRFVFVMPPAAVRR